MIYMLVNIYAHWIMYVHMDGKSIPKNTLLLINERTHITNKLSVGIYCDFDKILRRNKYVDAC